MISVRGHQRIHTASREAILRGRIGVGAAARVGRIIRLVGGV
jgi:hypothetical protein